MPVADLLTLASLRRVLAGDRNFLMESLRPRTARPWRLSSARGRDFDRRWRRRGQFQRERSASPLERGRAGTDGAKLPAPGGLAHVKRGWRLGALCDHGDAIGRADDRSEQLGAGLGEGRGAGASTAGGSAATGGGRRDGEKSGRSRVADRLANGIAATGLPPPSVGPACVQDADSAARQSDRATAGAVFTGRDARKRSQPARRAGVRLRPPLVKAGSRDRRFRETAFPLRDCRAAAEGSPRRARFRRHR